MANTSGKSKASCSTVNVALLDVDTRQQLWRCCRRTAPQRISSSLVHLLTPAPPTAPPVLPKPPSHVYFHYTIMTNKPCSHCTILAQSKVPDCFFFLFFALLTLIKGEGVITTVTLACWVCTPWRHQRHPNGSRRLKLNIWRAKYPDLKRAKANGNRGCHGTRKWPRTAATGPAQKRVKEGFAASVNLEDAQDFSLAEAPKPDVSHKLYHNNERCANTPMEQWCCLNHPTHLDTPGQTRVCELHSNPTTLKVVQCEHGMRDGEHLFPSCLNYYSRSCISSH